MLMTLRPVSDSSGRSRFARISTAPDDRREDPRWPVVALCARWNTAAAGGAPSASLQPLAVSTNLGAPDPGEVQLVTAVRKRGRRINVVDVELNQSGRTAVRPR